MQPRPRQTVRTSYDRLSAWYDLFSGAEAGVAQQALELLAPGQFERILEIGFGTGRVLAALARQVCTPGLIAGLDLSPGMARIASARLARGNSPETAHLTLGDAARLPYSPATFDGLFSAFTLELFETPEIPAVLEEYRRVLRPGGRLALVCLYQPPKPGLGNAIYEWFHRLLPDLVDCRPIPLPRLVIEAGLVPVITRQRTIWGLPVVIVVSQKK